VEAKARWRETGREKGYGEGNVDKEGEKIGRNGLVLGVNEPTPDSAPKKERRTASLGLLEVRRIPEPSRATASTEIRPSCSGTP